MVERLRALLKEQPFTQFTVVMSNGTRHEIRHPENALLTKHFLIIVDADNDEKIHDLYLLHVANVERRAASEPSSNR